MTKPSIRLTIVVGLATTLLLSTSSYAAEEALVYGLGLYNNSTCDTELGNPSNLIYADNMADNWHDEIAAWSSFESNIVALDWDPQGEDIEDTTFDGNGTDTQAAEGADAFDVAYLISHGTSGCGSVPYVEFGFPDTDATVSDDCRPRVGEDIEFGDGELDIFYAAGCNSAQLCAWENGAFADVDYGNFNLWGGFHGINTDGPAIPGNVTDFVSISRVSGAGAHWLIEMTNIRAGADNDDCGVAIAWADGILNANNYYTNAGIEDFAVGTGTHSMTRYYSVDGCDPADGGEL